MPYTSRRELTMPIPRYIADGLDPHARRRNITTQEMVRRILAQSIRDNIVDAIMDDENSAP